MKTFLTGRVQHFELPWNSFLGCSRDLLQLVFDIIPIMKNYLAKVESFLSKIKNKLLIEIDWRTTN